jgi:hypothetical protein
MAVGTKGVARASFAAYRADLLRGWLEILPPLRRWSRWR